MEWLKPKLDSMEFDQVFEHENDLGHHIQNLITVTWSFQYVKETKKDIILSCTSKRVEETTCCLIKKYSNVPKKRITITIYLANVRYISYCSN